MYNIERKMRMSLSVWITNDDGIGSEGIKKLAEIAGRLGDVTVFAPDGPQSGKSISLTLGERPKPMQVHEIIEGVPSFRIKGTPVDCVLGPVVYGYDLPDLILSGINLGYNAGAAVIYSGTVGAAMHGAILGIPSIAVSIGSEHPDFTGVDAYLEEILKKLIEHPAGKGSIWNVNFPSCPAEEIKGTVYDVVPDPQWFGYLRKNGPMEQTDLAYLRDNYISVGPLTSIVHGKQHNPVKLG